MITIKCIGCLLVVKIMSYRIKDHDEAYELYSHYDLAKGHCICTGLGFGVREIGC